MGINSRLKRFAVRWTWSVALLGIGTGTGTATGTGTGTALAQQEDPTNGNYFLPGCEAFVSNRLGDAKLMMQVGSCHGAVYVLQALIEGRGFALPLA